jgi:hypothetical protein
MDVARQHADLRTRSRLHQLPVTVLSSSGRNQTPGACGTQTRSSSGMRLDGDLGWMPGSWTIIGTPSGDQVAAVDGQHDAGDERGRGAGQEQHRPGDVLGRAPAASGVRARMGAARAGSSCSAWVSAVAIQPARSR